MAGTLTFKFKDVLPLIAHARNSVKFRPTFNQAYIGLEPIPEDQLKLKPALHFVKDSGAYLMSNGTPNILRIDVDKKYRSEVKKEAEKQHKLMFFDEANQDIWRDRIHEYAKYKLMKPLDWAKEVDACGANNLHVVYAIGHDSRKSDYHESGGYDFTREVCGNDDFVELFEIPRNSLIDRMIAEYNAGTRKFLKVKLTEETIKWY